MLKKIYLELVAIKKELQAIRSSLESSRNLAIIADCNSDDLVKENIQKTKIIGI